MRLARGLAALAVLGACLLAQGTALAARSGLDRSYGENGVVAVAPHLAGYQWQGVLGLDAS